MATSILGTVISLWSPVHRGTAPLPKMAWCWSGENRSNRNLSFLYFAETCRSVAFRLPSSVVGFLPYTSILLIDPPHETAWFEGGGFIWPDGEEKQAAASANCV